MTPRVPTDPELIGAAYRLAGLSATTARVTEMCSVMDNVLGLLDSLHARVLGDTPLPTTFDASWEVTS
jgi:hypothetical protein